MPTGSNIGTTPITIRNCSATWRSRGRHLSGQIVRDNRSLQSHFEPSIYRVPTLCGFGFKGFQGAYNRSELLVGRKAGRECDNSRMQTRVAGEPDKVAHIDRNQDPIFGEGTLPQDVIGCAGQAAIPHVVGVKTQIVETAS